MGRFDKLVNSDGVSNDTVDQRAIDENTYPENNPRNWLIDNTLGKAAKTIDPYSGQSDKFLNAFRMNKAEIDDAKARQARLLGGNATQEDSDAMLQDQIDMAMNFSTPLAMGSTRTVKEMVKKFGPEIGEIIGKELERKAANIYGSAHVDPYLSKAITKAGQMQRHFSPNDPEAIMERITKMNPGRLASSLEHIGDLPFTMTGTWGNNGERLLADVAKQKPFDIERSIGKVKGGYGLPNLLAKDNGSLGMGYPALREHGENLASNFNWYNKMSPKESPEWFNKLRDPYTDQVWYGDFKDFINKNYKQYSDAHRALPAYNEPFWQAREAAANIGDLKIDKAAQNLQRYLKIMDVPMEGRLNAMSRAEKIPNNNELLSRLGMQYPDKAAKLQGNEILDNILKWNAEKNFTQYVNPHDAAINDINLIKALKSNPQDWAEFIKYHRKPIGSYDSGAFKNIYIPEGSDKVVKRFNPESYVDMTPAAIQEQLVFNKLKDITPKTNTYKTSENIYQVQDKVTPFKELFKNSDTPIDYAKKERFLESLLKERGYTERLDLHPANHGLDAAGKQKVFDVGTFTKAKKIDSNELDQLDKSFKTLPMDKEYLNELFNLKAGK